jgi:cytochrome b561
MPRSDPAGRYTSVAIALHWAIAALVIAQVAWGWWMLGIPKQPPGPRVDAFNLHKSVGLAILALMLVRIIWRIGHRPPASPPLPAWQAAAARATHLLLYAALLVQPIAGYLGSAWSGYPVKFFGLALPAWAAKDAALKELMSGVHLATSWVIVVAVGLHVVAALKHAFIDRDGLLARMGIGRPG